jgi:OFA family oxalate/formate antiporter-like MFS transporter
MQETPSTGGDYISNATRSGVNITITSASVPAVASVWTRWGQLALGVVCMVMIANLQYGWTLFINPIDDKYQWGRAAIQVAFTIFIVTETWLQPVGGYLIDRFGPRVMVCIGGALVATAWAINSVADSLALFYLAAIITGLGASPIFGATVGNALKWFPDRRGLAAGLTSAGFGAGSALTVVPLANMIQSGGYEAAYLWFGLGQGIVVMVVALLLRAPKPAEIVAPGPALVQQGSRDYRPAAVLKSPPFWLMYAMFVMVGSSGLMATAQLAPIAKDFAIDSVPVSLLGLTMPALSFALSVGLVLNGLSRPLFGWVSDRIGRENTMFIAFLLEGIGISALLLCAGNPMAFVLSSGLVYLAWGQIFALFPATCTDLYGRKFATANYGMLYTAKGTAALLVPLANVLATATGSWTAVFVVASVLNVVAATLALVALKPLRQRALAEESLTAPDSNIRSASASFH